MLGVSRGARLEHPGVHEVKHDQSQYTGARGWEY